MDTDHRESDFISFLACDNKFFREQKWFPFHFPIRGSPYFPDGVDLEGNKAEMHLGILLT